MSILKRLSTSVLSRVDRLVCDIEDHDAIVESALKDVRRNSAHAKVRLARVQADGKCLGERLEKLRDSERLWRERAVRSAGADREAALECTRRGRECGANAKRVESAITEHAAMETRLAKQVAKLDRRVEKVQEQRNLMRSRQSTAEALRTLQSIDYGGLNVEDTFERWEVTIAEAEQEIGSPTDPMTMDHLEQRFIDQETRADLENELDGWLANDREAGHEE